MGGRDNDNTQIGKLVPIAILVCFAICVICLPFQPYLMGVSAESARTTNIGFGDGWTTPDGTPVSLDSLNDIPGFAEQGATIQKRLPSSIEPGIELNFRSNNLTLHLFYDDTEAYSFDPTRQSYEMPYASHFNYAQLSPADAHKLATLKLMPVYADSNAEISDVYLGFTSAYIQRFVRTHGIALIESLFIAFIGFAVLLLETLQHNRDSNSLDLISLGSMLVLLGTWSESVTLVLQMVIGHEALIGALEYMSLLFVPYFIVRFSGSLVQPHQRKRYEIVALAIAVVCIGLTLVLAYTRHVDMHRLLPISHAQLLACAALVLAQSISGIRWHSHGNVRKLLEQNRVVVWAFLLFMLCALADFIKFSLSWQFVDDAAFFMRHGMLIFSFALAYQAILTSVHVLQRAEYADTVEVIAFTDTLTGISNRAAWSVMEDQVDAALQDGSVSDALVCQFDVNYLKRANDTYGHEAGDRLLKRAAETIARSFGIEGSCYRTGGDEFTAILAGENLDERLEECKQLFDLSIAEQNETGEGEVPLSIALGYARTSEVEPHNVQTAQNTADERMYKNKRAMKAGRDDLEAQEEDSLR